MSEPNKPQPKPAPPAGKYLGAGLIWVGSTGLFMYLGSLLDKAWASKPAFTVIGAFVGGAAGFYYLYRQLMGNGPHEGDKKDRKR